MPHYRRASADAPSTPTAQTVASLAGQLLTRRDVAAILGVSVETVHRLVAEGHLPTVPGMRSRISRATVAAYLGADA